MTGEEQWVLWEEVAFKLAPCEWELIIQALKHCARPSHRNVGSPGFMDEIAEQLEVRLEHARRQFLEEFSRQG